MEAPATVDLLQRAKAGSSEAVNLLYERCGGRLLSYIRLRMGRELRARLESGDILQATFLKSLTHLHQLGASETGSLMAWLARIADNEIRDRVDYQQRQRRDAAREVPIEDEGAFRAAGRSALTQIILDEEALRLEEALDSLSPAHREAILLRKFEELSFAEIGRRVGKSEDACRMLLARAMTALTLKLSEAPR